MAYNYRCTTKKCRKRVTLKRHIRDYKRVPKCPNCGGKLSYDPALKRQTQYRGLCYCDGYSWSAKGGPHRRGSQPWCIHSDREPTEEEYKERYYDYTK